MDVSLSASGSSETLLLHLPLHPVVHLTVTPICPPPPPLSVPAPPLAPSSFWVEIAVAPPLHTQSGIHSLPRFKCEWGVLVFFFLGNSGHPHCLPHSKREWGGSVLFFTATTATTTPSVAANVSRGFLYSVLGNDGNTPLLQL